MSRFFVATELGMRRILGTEGIGSSFRRAGLDCCDATTAEGGGATMKACVYPDSQPAGRKRDTYVG